MWWKSVFLWIQCTNKNNIITKTERFKLNDSYYSKKSRPDVKVHKINEVNILKTINLNWKIKIESSFNFCAVFPIYYYDFDLSWEKPILPNSLQTLQKKYTTKHMMKFQTAMKKKCKRNIKSNLFDPKKATRSSKWFQTRNCTGSSSNLTFYHCNTNLYGFGGIDWTFSVLDSIKWFWTLLKLLDSDRSDLRSFVYDLLCEYYRWWWWWWTNAI